MDINTVLILAVLFVVIVNGVFQAVTLQAVVRALVDIHNTTRDIHEATKDIHEATKDIHETTRRTLELVFQQSQTRGGA